MKEKYLSKYFGSEEARKLSHYEKRNGYEQAREIYKKKTKPEKLTQTVKDSHLRGLGGAGFATGVKWSFIPKDDSRPRYLVVNGDEAEPGTFKDKNILIYDPHRLIEGILIACYAIQSHKCFVYIRGEYWEPYQRLKGACEEAYRKGFLGKKVFGMNYSLDIVIHRGAGAYVCGEESALLESIEGKKGYPRLKPPFPAVKGLFDCPTIINNVETLSYLPIIFQMGAETFRSLGKGRTGGAHLVSVSGHVKNPGVYELPMGTPLREIIFDAAGGIRGDKQLKAVIPGGISSPVLTADEIDIPYDFDSLHKAKTMLGSSGLMVLDADTDMVQALLVACRFFAHESCGQCTPCREGTSWMVRILKRIAEGNGRPKDIDDLIGIAEDMAGNSICALGEASIMPVMSYITKFRHEFEAAIGYELCALQKGENR